MYTNGISRRFGDAVVEGDALAGMPVWVLFLSVCRWDIDGFDIFGVEFDKSFNEVMENQQNINS